MADRRILDLAQKLYRRQIDRRDFIRQAAALGASAAAVNLFVRGAAAQETDVLEVIPADQGAPVVTEPCEGDTCLFAGQTVTFLLPNESIQVPIFEVREEFEAATGATLEIVTLPMNDVLPRLLEDVVSGTGTFDTSIIGAWWLGELVEGDFLQPLTPYLADSKYPAWDLDAILPGPRALMEYGGELYVSGYDHDGQVFYYRRDLLTDPEHQAAFAEEFGYDLPVPPQTWDQAIDIAQYFNGKDWDGDGEPESGVTMHLKVGGQAFFHFMSYSAPFVIGPENEKHYWFNPEDMTPLITSPGHVAAINSLVELAQHGPEAMYGWALGESWDYFLGGKAAITFTWGDLGALAQETPERGGKSLVRGMTASAAIPGTDGYYNPVTNEQFDTEEPNIVGNTTGGSWAPVLSKFSKSPEATYFLLALLADSQKAMTYAGRGFDGVDPGATFQFPEPNGTATVQDYVDLGWDEQDAIDYTDAYFQVFGNTQQFPYLRIPGTFEYWLSLDTNLSRAMIGELTPEEALQTTADEWEQITDRFGRDLQLASYKSSLGFE
jgi:multiple sugar transport system substrate-binding protein